MAVACPNCNSDDLALVRELPDGRREIACSSCGHTWIRGEPVAPQPQTGPVGRPGTARRLNQDLNPQLSDEQAMAQATGIAAATHLWVEAGAMSGPPEARHQIEFAGELVGFFIQPIRGSEDIPMTSSQGGVLHWRPLTARGQSYGQWTDIWRLGLPTANMGGPAYPGQILLFTKRQLDGAREGTRVVFQVEVASPDSEQARAWEADARRHGHVGRTGGGHQREYGWW